MADTTRDPGDDGGDVRLRLSSLCDRRVLDAAGEEHGKVLDLRLVRDGPTNVSGDAAVRIDGLVVGESSWVEHIGLFRHTVHGPWLLEAIARLLVPPRSYLPWNQLIDPRRLAAGDPVRFTGELRDLPDRDGSAA